MDMPFNDVGGEVSSGVAVALGRIEANIQNLTNLTKDNAVQMKEIDNRLRAVETAVAQKPDDDRLRTLESKMDTRLTSVERAVSTAQETRRTPVPWYTVAAGIASILGIVATVFLLLNLKLLVG